MVVVGLEDVVCVVVGTLAREHTSAAAAPRAAAPGGAHRLRLVTSQGSPYPSRSPRAHPSGWTRTTLVPYRPLAHAGLT